MKSFTLSFPFAATNKMWIFGHDVMGGIALVVLLVLGYFFHKHRLKQLTDTPGETSAAKKISRIQMWILYLGVMGVVIFFFFIYPRATSQEAQTAPERVPAEHAE